jgi:hypothetical protein
MAHQSSASITLPRDFKFSYTSDDENNDKVDMPRTPARPSNPIDSFDLGVPAPPKQTFKLRRRPRDQADTGAMDEAPILPSVEMPSPRLHGSFFTHVHPSIEMTEAPELASFSFSDMSTSDYLAPGDGPLRLLSPPKTPASQVTTYLTESSGAIEWSMFHPFHPYDLHARPTSALSTFSDSSATSHGSSFDSKSSFDAGSCTSPESGSHDTRKRPPQRQTRKDDAPRSLYTRNGRSSLDDLHYLCPGSSCYALQDAAWHGSSSGSLSPCRARSKGNMALTPSFDHPAHLNPGRRLGRLCAAVWTHG